MSDSLVLWFSVFPPTLESYFRNSEALGLTIEFPVCLASQVFPIEYTNGIKRGHKKNISILGIYIQSDQRHLMKKVINFKEVFLRV